jgi:uncharacterized protein (TIGR03083 family)
MDRDLVWGHIHAERTALRDLLADLTPQEWETPSLCAGWRVREVAAHLMIAPAVGPGEAVREVVKAAGRVNVMIDRTTRRAAQRPVAEILADFTTYAGSRRHPLGTTILDPLLDVLVHTQDIVVPLGRRHDMPLEAVALVLPRVRWLAPAFGTFGLVRSHRFEATDLDWSVGRGELVRGTAQELLMALTGRPAKAPG